MLILITLLFVAVAAVAGAVEYWLWLQRRSSTHPAEQDPDQRAERREQRRVSLVIESVATVGAMLVLAGSGVSISQRWLLVTDWGRVGILAGVASGFLIAGFLVRWFTASATQPLTELMWCASAGCITAASVIAAAAIYGQPAAMTLLIASGTAAIYSMALWLMCQREMLLVVALAGLVGALCGAIPVAIADATPWLAVGLGLWLIGLAWIAVGWVYPEPLGTSITVGAVLALVGPVIALHQTDWAYLVGIATAAAVMAVSVPLRNVVLVAFGSCALLGYITAVVLQYADRWVGVPESLVIIGLVLIATAIVTVRLGRASHRGPRAV
jgi:hypothetical protein